MLEFQFEVFVSKKERHSHFVVKENLVFCGQEGSMTVIDIEKKLEIYTGLFDTRDQLNNFLIMENDMVIPVY